MAISNILNNVNYKDIITGKQSVLSTFDSIIKNTKTGEKAMLASVDSVGFTTLLTGVLYNAESVSYSSSVTDNLVEDRRYIHDMIVNNPITFNLGFVISDRYTETSQTKELLSKVASTLGTTGIYAPNLTDGALEMVNKARSAITTVSSFADSVISAGNSILNVLSKKNITQSNIVNVSEKLKTIERQKKTVSIYAFGTKLENMVIESLNISRRPDQSLDRVDVSVSLKQIEQAKFVFTSTTREGKQSRIYNKLTSTSSIGTSKAKTTLQSSAYKTVSALGNFFKNKKS
jgi:hypothetical protein